MLARVNQEAMKAKATDTGKEAQSPVVEAKNPRRKAVEEQPRNTAPSRTPSEPSQQIAINRPRRPSFSASKSEQQTSPPPLREPRVSEPILSSKNVENSAPKTQLNVKWEN
jgi:hypothetical protein